MCIRDSNNTMPGFENLSTAKMGGFLESLGLTKGYGSMMPTISGGILAASALPLLMGQKEEEDNNDDYYKTNSLNIADIRNNPYNYFIPGYRVMVNIFSSILCLACFAVVFLSTEKTGFDIMLETMTSEGFMLFSSDFIRLVLVKMLIYSSA